VTVTSSLFDEHMGVLMSQKAHTDVVFVAGSVGFVAHRFMLAAASPSLQRLLCSAEPMSELSGARSSSEASIVSTLQYCVDTINLTSIM
jgi:Rho-related BTB domain-containing protein 1/2